MNEEYLTSGVDKKLRRMYDYINKIIIRIVHRCASYTYKLKNMAIDVVDN